MTVKDLKEAISNLPNEMEVVLQKDSGGNNGYSPLYSADPNAVYIAKKAWYGEVYSMDWTPEDACMTDSEWAEVKSKPRTLILHPVN